MAYSDDMVETINVYDAKTNLSRLLARVEAGEEITLSRNGRPVARLVPMTSGIERRMPGVWKSQVAIADDFDIITDAELRDWYGE